MSAHRIAAMLNFTRENHQRKLLITVQEGTVHKSYPEKDDQEIPKENRVHVLILDYLDILHHTIMNL